MQKKNSIIVKYTSNSLKDTLNIGKQLAKNLKPGAVISLTGPLGAGKTALVKGIAKGLRIKEEITSPTFTIISVYQGSLPLYHVDLYRIHEAAELCDIGLDEIMAGQGITAIEWPEKAINLLPEHTLAVTIRIQTDGTREIHIQGWTNEYISS
ncbi:MAG: tRNA (adenosine(37)-N6)-threonylcarbamoyltransferase complex ATPase subunit type 1 TsaE [Spirochaetales bacterium]|nr:tRNA (adenosine(37)-N6)-threonylcarbamoyltransferase complex ATPase subunit type 1 TsaE [Spirochaetales bacterium]